MLLHLQFSEPAPAPPANRLPLSSLWQRKAVWEYALEALGQLIPKNSASDSRLVWQLTMNPWGTEIVPLEQKRNKQGWTKGRAVVLKRLHDASETLPWLLEQDRQIIRHIHYISGYSYYEHGRYRLCFAGGQAAG